MVKKNLIQLIDAAGNRHDALNDNLWKNIVDICKEYGDEELKSAAMRCYVTTWMFVNRNFDNQYEQEYCRQHYFNELKMFEEILDNLTD